MNNQKVELKRTELHIIQSKINFQKYDVYVRLPNGYETRPENKTYDVVYILNGQWDFGLMLSVYGSLAYDGLLPEMILVGIGWNGQNTDEEAQKLNMRDYSVFVKDGKLDGGAHSFLDVLEHEIILFVEQKFAVSDTRGLTGSSLAAWFALFAAFHKPYLFKKYILSSPITAFANGLLFYFESLFFQQIQQLNAFFYISYGQLELNQPIKDFIKLMISRNYKDFEIVENEIVDVGHTGNKPIGYTKGILRAYGTQKVDLTVK